MSGKKGRWKIVLGIMLVAVVLVAGGAYLWLSRATEPVHYEDAVSLASREENSRIVTALAVGGIERPLVDVTADRVYIAYELPAAPEGEAADANATAEREAAFQRYALGVAAGAQTAAANFVVAQLVDGEPHRLWSVDADVAESYAAGDITYEAYDAEIAKVVFD